MNGLWEVERIPDSTNYWNIDVQRGLGNLLKTPRQLDQIVKDAFGIEHWFDHSWSIVCSYGHHITGRM